MVGRAHGDDPIREADGPCEGIARAEVREGFGMVGERRQPAEVGGALVAERVNREDRWGRRIQVGERRRRMPVVQVDNGGLEAAGQRRHRGGERVETNVVVGPRRAIGLDIRVGSSQAIGRPARRASARVGDSSSD